MKKSISKKLLSLFLALMMIVTSVPMFAMTAFAADADKYLFAYFTGNTKYGQQIRFAVSEDGYNFTALNNNKPVVSQTKGSSSTSSGYVRDPYIARDVNGNGYWMVATDMDATYGIGMHKDWNGDSCIYTFHSDNLTDWNQVACIDMRNYAGFETTLRAWAPQFIWDAAKGQYMIYLTIYLGDWSNNVYALYTNDFKTTAAPQVITLNKSVSTGAIDSDIVYDNGTYYMYYKDEDSTKTSPRIWVATASNLTGPYTELKEVSSTLSDKAVEGNAMYQISGTNTWVMMLDEYNDGSFAYGTTTDFLNFTKLDIASNNSALAARHGSVMQITDEEYNRLVNHSFTSSDISLTYQFDTAYTHNDWSWNDTSADASGLRYQSHAASGTIGEGVCNFNNGSLWIVDDNIRQILTTDSFSVSVDVTKTNADLACIVGIANATEDFIEVLSDGKLVVKCNDGSTKTANFTPVATNVEATYTLSYDGNVVLLLIDGDPVALVQAKLPTRDMSVLAGIGYTDSMNGTNYANRLTGRISKLSFSPNSFQFSADGSEILSLMSDFEDMLESGTIYTNMSNAYEAYVKCRKAYDAYHYGNDSAVDISAAATELKTAMSVMTEWQLPVANATPTFDKGTVPTNAYSNLLYSNKRNDYSAVEFRYVSNTWSALITYKCYTTIQVGYNETIMFYDGTSTPKMPVMFMSYYENAVGGSRTHYVYTVYPITSDLSLTEMWYNRGNYQKWNFGDVYGNTSYRVGHNASTLNAGFNFGSAEKKYIAHANVLQFDANTNWGSDYYKQYKNLTWYARSGEKDKIFEGSGTGSSTGNVNDKSTIYVINYKPLREAILNNADELKKVSQYSEGGLSALFKAFDKATCFNVNNYDYANNTLGNVQTVAGNISEAVTAFNNAGTSFNKDSKDYADLRKAMDKYLTNSAYLDTKDDLGNSYTVSSVAAYKDIFEASQDIFADVYPHSYVNAAMAANNAVALDCVLNYPLNLDALKAQLANKSIFDDNGNQVYTYSSWANNSTIQQGIADYNNLSTQSKYPVTTAQYSTLSGDKNYDKVNNVNQQTTANNDAFLLTGLTLDDIDTQDKYDSFDAAKIVVDSIEKERYTSDSYKDFIKTVNEIYNTVYVTINSDASQKYNSVTSGRPIETNEVLKGTGLKNNTTDAQTKKLLEAVSELVPVEYTSYLIIQDENGAVIQSRTPVATLEYGDLFTFDVSNIAGDNSVVWSVALYNKGNVDGNPVASQKVSGYYGSTLERKADYDIVVTANIKSNAKDSGVVLKVYNGYYNVVDVIYADTLDAAKAQLPESSSMPFYTFQGWTVRPVSGNVYEAEPEFDATKTVAITGSSDVTVSGKKCIDGQAELNTTVTVSTASTHLGWAVEVDGKYQIVSYSAGDYTFSAIADEKYVPIMVAEDGYTANGTRLTPANVDGFSVPVDFRNVMTDQQYLDNKIKSRDPFISVQLVEKLSNGKVNVYARVTANGDESQILAYGLYLEKANGQTAKFASTTKNTAGQFYMTIAANTWNSLSAVSAYVTFDYSYTNVGSASITTTEFAAVDKNAVK